MEEATQKRKQEEADIKFSVIPSLNVKRKRLNIPHNTHVSSNTNTIDTSYTANIKAGRTNSETTVMETESENSESEDTEEEVVDKKQRKKKPSKGEVALMKANATKFANYRISLNHKLGRVGKNHFYRFAIFSPNLSKLSNSQLKEFRVKCGDVISVWKYGAIPLVVVGISSSPHSSTVNFSLKKIDTSCISPPSNVHSFDNPFPATLDGPQDVKIRANELTHVWELGSIDKYTNGEEYVKESGERLRKYKKDWYEMNKLAQKNNPPSSPIATRRSRRLSNRKSGTSNYNPAIVKTENSGEEDTNHLNPSPQSNLSHSTTPLHHNPSHDHDVTETNNCDKTNQDSSSEVVASFEKVCKEVISANREICKIFKEAEEKHQEEMKKLMRSILEQEEQRAADARAFLTQLTKKNEEFMLQLQTRRLEEEKQYINLIFSNFSANTLPSLNPSLLPTHNTKMSWDRND